MADFSELVGGVIAASNLQPRDYQRRIVEKLLSNCLNDGVTSNLIESPTGSGKTNMALLASKCLQLHFADEGLTVVWIAMRRPLLDQVVRENITKGLAVQDFHPVSMFIRDLDSLKTIREGAKKLLLVIDEAQHDAAGSMGAIYDAVRPDFVLGLTATPFRTDNLKLCFHRVIKDAGIHQLIGAGWLSKFDHYSILNWDVETVAGTYVREKEHWGKSLFYMRNLQECYALCSLISPFARCEVVDGESDCEDQIARFERGELDALINCVKLTEGFDCPSLETVFVRDGSRGVTIQMAGRVLRLHEGKRKKIVQSINTKWNFLKTAWAVCQYKWSEDAWVSLTLNPKLEEITDFARVAIATVDVQIPQLLVKKPGIRGRRGRTSRRGMMDANAVHDLGE